MTIDAGRLAATPRSGGSGRRLGSHMIKDDTEARDRDATTIVLALLRVSLTISDGAYGMQQPWRDPQKRPMVSADCRLSFTNPDGRVMLQPRV